MELSKARLDELEKLLAVFPYGMLQDFLTFTRHCEKHGIDIEEVQPFINHFAGAVAWRQDRIRAEIAKIYDDKAPHCPACDLVMKLEDVNNRPSRMIDDHSKSWWVCPNLACEGEPIVNDKYTFEILSEMGIQVHQRPAPQSSSAKRRKAANLQRGKGKRRR